MKNTVKSRVSGTFEDGQKCHREHLREQNICSITKDDRRKSCV
nr:MAG TPA: hypothetical protein [Caudoviricetes sp.]DAP83564.1 MAG TPA: hypothetical protein [Caudoviricetes sp.]